ncbi:MAG: NRDE family protein [Neptuniibacter sp.]
MCLMTFAYKSHPVYSFILLANRDEFYARPSLPMHFWNEQPDLLAGQDLEQGGTWLGINKQGKFTAVTNYRDGKTAKGDALSRGALTREYLCSSLPASQYLEQLQPRQGQFGDYNLLLGDASGLCYQSNREGPVRKLTPGIYGLSNALLNTPWPKLLQVRSLLSEALSQLEPDKEQLFDIMSDPLQAEPSQLPDTGISEEWEQLLSSCFIQSSEYGTRATTVLMQKTCGETTIIEKNFGPDGFESEQTFELKLPAIGYAGSTG